MLALVVWAVRVFPTGHPARRASWAGLGFIGLEALLGAGLVLLRYVEQNASLGRVFYLCAHLTNTLLLVAVLAAAAYPGDPPGAPTPLPRPLSVALGLVLAAAVTGVVAALATPSIRPNRSPRASSVSSPAPPRRSCSCACCTPWWLCRRGAYLFLVARMSLEGRLRVWATGLVFAQFTAAFWMCCCWRRCGCRSCTWPWLWGVWLAFALGALETQRAELYSPKARA